MKKLYILAFALLSTMGLSAQTVLYSNELENDTGDASIVGNGEIVEEETAGFGSVFHNAAGGQAICCSPTIFLHSWNREARNFPSHFG